MNPPGRRRCRRRPRRRAPGRGNFAAPSMMVRADAEPSVDASPRTLAAPPPRLFRRNGRTPLPRTPRRDPGRRLEANLTEGPSDDPRGGSYGEYAADAASPRPAPPAYGETPRRASSKFEAEHRRRSGERSAHAPRDWEDAADSAATSAWMVIILAVLAVGASATCAKVGACKQFKQRRAPPPPASPPPLVPLTPSAVKLLPDKKRTPPPSSGKKKPVFSSPKINLSPPPSPQGEEVKEDRSSEETSSYAIAPNPGPSIRGLVERLFWVAEPESTPHPPVERDFSETEVVVSPRATIRNLSPGLSDVEDDALLNAYVGDDAVLTTHPGVVVAAEDDDDGDAPPATPTFPGFAAVMNIELTREEEFE